MTEQYLKLQLLGLVLGQILVVILLKIGWTERFARWLARRI